jgi:hypothetical protein
MSILSDAIAFEKECWSWPKLGKALASASTPEAIAIISLIKERDALKAEVENLRARLEAKS